MALNTEAIVMPINDTIELSQVYPQYSDWISHFFLLCVTKKNSISLQQWVSIRNIPYK